MPSDSFDVIVIGGGPAGLTAALYLARARKRTLVLDDDRPRNAVAEHAHGFLGLDGRPPAEIRAAGRASLARYAEVEIRMGRASTIERDGAGLSVVDSTGAIIRARRILLATGVRDELPKHPGLRERYGASVFSCPYCHGHENRDRRWGIHVSARAVVRTAPMYRGWTSSLVALLDGRTDLDDAAIRSMTDRGIAIEPRKIVALHGEGRALAEIELEGGDRIPLDALLVAPPKRHSDVVLMAGIQLDEAGYVKTKPEGGDLETSLRGVYVCGDAAGIRPHAVIAAADGATAAMQIADALTLEDLGAPR